MSELAAVVELWGREPDVVSFPIVLVRRATGAELARLPGMDDQADRELGMAFAAGGAVDAVDVRDPLLVVWASDWPDADVTSEERLARRLRKARRR